MTCPNHAEFKPPACYAGPVECFCKNCKHVRKQKSTAMRAVSQAASQGVPVSDHVVFCWNETVKNFPCLRNR